MLRQHDDQAELLGKCIDLLMEDLDWEQALPAQPRERQEMMGLVAVAQRLLGLSRRTHSLEPAQKRRVWAVTRDQINDENRPARLLLLPAFVPI